MGVSYLYSGEAFFVDDEDLGLVQALSWYAVPVKDTTYAATSGPNGRQYMHRLIMAAPAGLEVDHIDLDGLNNRRTNLRVVTHALNLANQRAQSGRSSRFKGVARYRNGWEAYIKVDGRKRGLGHFRDEMDAARAYDRAAIEAWGEYARPNLVMSVS